MKKVGPTLAVTAVVASLAFAADGPSIERGKELFNSLQLGTNGKSCASCHAGGKRLEHAAARDDAELAKIINNCIKGPIEGVGLDPASADMKSLVMYVRSFAAVGKE